MSYVDYDNINCEDNNRKKLVLTIMEDFSSILPAHTTLIATIILKTSLSRNSHGEMPSTKIYTEKFWEEETNLIQHVICTNLMLPFFSGP